MFASIGWPGGNAGRGRHLTQKFLTHVRPTGIERHFSPDDVIVSKTDLTGRITYANSVFLKVAGLTEDEAIGAPHSLIRHPDMPRAVFKLVWDTIESGREIFGYVLNMASTGDHYWVFAHVTPTFDEQGRIVSYHSNRRVPRPEAVAAVEPLYAHLCEIERSIPERTKALEASCAELARFLQDRNTTYERLVFSL